MPSISHDPAALSHALIVNRMETALKKELIGYLHAFRGVAILSIVGAHAWSVLLFVSGLQARDPGAALWLSATTEALFHGTTLFFALVSGLLYTRVLRGMPWKQFFLAKLTNVVLPYFVVSTALTMLYWSEVVAEAASEKKQVDFLSVLAENLVTGRASLQLWYIPVLLALFLLTPLLERLLTLRNGVCLLLLAVLPLVVSRTVFPDLLSLNTLVYFLGAYALGMLLGERLDRVIPFVTVHRTALLVVFAISLAVNFLLFHWEYAPSGFFSAQQLLVYVNKISAALLLLQWLHALGERTPKVLYTLGTYSFGLYFVHMMPVWALDQLLIAHMPTLSAGHVAVGGLAVYALAVLTSLLFCMGLKRVFGSRSRALIGV